MAGQVWPLPSRKPISSSASGDAFGIGHRHSSRAPTYTALASSRRPVPHDSRVSLRSPKNEQCNALRVKNLPLLRSTVQPWERGWASKSQFRVVDPVRHCPDLSFPTCKTGRAFLDLDLLCRLKNNYRKYPGHCPAVSGHPKSHRSNTNDFYPYLPSSPPPHPHLEAQLHPYSSPKVQVQVST